MISPFMRVGSLRYFTTCTAQEKTTGKELSVFELSHFSICNVSKEVCLPVWRVDSSSCKMIDGAG